MRAYAALIGELHIVSAAPPGAAEVNEGSLHLHPTHSWKIFRIDFPQDQYDPKHDRELTEILREEVTVVG